jgi:hypothetical protein
MKIIILKYFDNFNQKWREISITTNFNLKKYAKYFIYIAVLSVVMISLKAAIFTPGWWFYPDPGISDEQVWRNVTVHPFSAETQSLDNKSPVFLWVMYVLQIDHTVLYTRLLNYMILLIITYLMYRQTKRVEVLFVPIFVIYTDLPILYDTTLELVFVLLAVNFPQHSGLFTGLAGISRPYAFAYTVLLKRKQALVTIIIGLALVVIMYLTGGLLPYWREVTTYGTTSDYSYWWRYSTFFESALILSLTIVTWAPRKKLFQFACMSCLPLLLRTYGHYYIVPTVLFFYLYCQQLSLQTKINKNKEEKTNE